MKGRKERKGEAFEDSIFPAESVFLASENFCWDQMVSFPLREHPIALPHMLMSPNHLISIPLTDHPTIQATS